MFQIQSEVIGILNPAKPVLALLNLGINKVPVMYHGVIPITIHFFKPTSQFECVCLLGTSTRQNPNRNPEYVKQNVT